MVLIVNYDENYSIQNVFVSMHLNGFFSISIRFL